MPSLVMLVSMAVTVAKRCVSMDTRIHAGRSRVMKSTCATELIHYVVKVEVAFRLENQMSLVPL